MKKTKRIVSMFMACMLALSILVLPAFAIEDTLTDGVAVDSATTDNLKTYWNYGTVNTPGTALRSAPDMYDDTNIGGLLQQGDRVKILQGVNDDLGREWYYVQVSTGDNAGNYGYVFAAYITLD